MKIQFFIFLLFISFHLFSQKYTISGTVTDSKTGETLSGVTIIIKNKPIGTTTNQYGFYSIDLKEKKQTLIYSYLGYVTIEKVIDTTESSKINIHLEEDNTALNEIVISSSTDKAVKKLKTAQMSVTRLSSNSIKNTPVVLGETDILKAITLQPGVTNSGEGSAGFNVRGGAADQNLVLLDEATIYNTSHLFGFFSVFNVDAIKDIKLYKGGIPPQFGGRIASVLDVKQKDGNNKEYHTTGGIGLISSRLMVEGPIKENESSFLIAGRTSYVNLFLKMAGEENRISFYDINAKVSYKLNDNNRLFLSGYFGNDNLKLGTDFIESNYGNFSFNLRWNHLFNNKLFSNLSLIYSQYKYDLLLRSNGIDWISDIKNYNLKYDFNYNITNNFKINFGTQAQLYKFNPGELKANAEKEIVGKQFDKETAIEPSLYIGVKQNIGTKLSLNYGARLGTFLNQNEEVYEYQNNQPLVFNESFGIYERGIRTGKSNDKTNFYVGLEPRISLSYLINPTTSVKASFHKTYQYLHQISNTNSPSPLDLWSPSGEYIEPQNSQQFALGYFKNFKDEMYSLEVESYYKTVKNRLDYIDGANLIANDYLETELLSGKSRAYGLEFLLQKNKGKFKGSLAYTISKTEQQVLGRTEKETGINNGKWYNAPYDRTHDISLNASYSLNEKWTFNANFIYQTGRPTNYPSGKYSIDDTIVPIFLTRNESRLPSYHRLDISATLTPKNEDTGKLKGEWVFGIYNLYGRRNANSITFRKNKDTGKNEAIRTSIFSSLIPAITYNFKF